MEAPDGTTAPVDASSEYGLALERVKQELHITRDLLHRYEEAENHLTDQLGAIIEIANELSMTENVDALCRRAVELGCERLDFDRLGIWFRTDEPDVVTGSFGIDEHGNVRDERGLCTRVSPDDPDGRILLCNEPYAMVGEAPLLDSRGETVGRASQIFAALWDGERVIGHISADNRLHHAPLVRQQCHVLRAYGSLLGYLCTRKSIEQEHERLIDELQEALLRIKTLHGLIPICANCKSIRNDEGLWERIEDYIQEHSEADFSHGLCPDCIRKLYPDLQMEGDEAAS